ncbi:hypothetical protein D3C87_1746280 [compost metagenome]
MGDDDGKERRRRIEDRGKPAGNMGLAPDDQAEGNDVVEQAHAEKGAPYGPLPWQMKAHDAADDQQCRGSEADTQRDDGDGWQFLDGNADEKERSAPQQRERHKHPPFAGIHLFLYCHLRLSHR